LLFFFVYYYYYYCHCYFYFKHCCHCCYCYCFYYLVRINPKPLRGSFLWVDPRLTLCEVDPSGLRLAASGSKVPYSY